MAYLTRWRLHLAAQSREKTSRGVAEIAADVGYEFQRHSIVHSSVSSGSLLGRYRSDRTALPAQRPQGSRRLD